MISPSPLRLAAALGLIALNGCDRGKDESTQAAGEILEGTASDAMLQTDLIRAEAPLAPRKAGTGEAGKAPAERGPRTAGAPAGETPAPVAPETPEPTATPAATPPPPAE